MRRLRPSLALAFAAALVASAVFTATASADPRWVKDGNDIRGFLDMEAVMHGHGGSRSILQHRVRTFARWRSRKLQCGNIDLVFHRLDRTIRVRYDRGLYAEMLDARNGDLIGPVRVWRPNARTVAVSFPKRLLRAGITRYAWSAQTVTWGGACEPLAGTPPEDWDVAPNRRGIIHDLGAARLTGRS